MNIVKKSAALGALLVSVSALLVACGGTDPVPVKVAAADLTVPASKVVMSAFVGKTFTAAKGIPAFGTTSTTTISIGGTAAAQTASIKFDGQTLLADLEFGSCIFRIKQSTSPDWAVGKTLTVNPCTVTVNTKGWVANGDGNVAVVSMKIGDGALDTLLPGLTISPDGVLSFEGVQLGDVVVTLVTGGGS